jgi:hypothetical protein
MLPPDRQIDHAIHLDPNYKLPYGQSYNLSQLELKPLMAYIEPNIANGLIQWSPFSAAEPILFANNID